VIVLYLTGASNTWTRNTTRTDIGLMCQPGNKNHMQTAHYPSWAVDNACFTQGAKFRLDRFMSWLDGLPRKKCLFAVAPDVVGNAEATLTRSIPVMPDIRAMGFPVAFVAQNGLQHCDIPWSAFDVLFIGGDDWWKTCDPLVDITRQARQRGKWVHMGRVNTLGRIVAAHGMQCDSVDGTYLKYGPDVNFPKLCRWLDFVNAQPSLWEAA
jgi:hypothetical protein